MDLKNRESFKIGYGFYNLPYRDALVEGYKEGKAEGLNEGLTKGISQGVHQQAVSTARKMKDANTPIDSILRFTGLSAEEVNAL